MPELLKDVRIDRRSKEDILAAIREKALSYTPEWHMDEDNPDIGTALAVVYADMFAKTVRDYNRVPMKNCVAFFNSLNASLLPAIPAEGYASFSLVSDNVPGVEITAGTVLTADTPEGIVNYETEDDVFVTPAMPEAIYQTDDRQDYISCLKDPEKDKEQETPESLVFFRYEQPNLQKHMLYFCHNEVLDIRSDAWIELCFFARGSVPADDAFLSAFADESAAVFTYYAGEETGWVPLVGAKVKNGSLILHKEAGKPPFAPYAFPDDTGNENAGFTVRCEIRNMAPFVEFAPERFVIRSKGRHISCDTVTTGGMECDAHRFFPFGERFGLYDEIYFGSEEVLSKRGAEVTVSFNLNFAKVPIENQPERNVQYKWIANKKDFIPDPEYDIVIRRVLWEYYNGYGWTRLFPGHENETLFTADQGTNGQYKTMTFRCPDDMTHVMIGASETCYIRARIIKADNLYKVRGNFITPEVTNLTLAYTYGEQWRIPEYVTTCNNLSSVTRKGTTLTDETGRFRPFLMTGHDKSAVYISFQQPPKGAPIKMLITLHDKETRVIPNLSWEYCTKSGWKPLNMADETESFSQSGLIVMLDNIGFANRKLFGRDAYWIRITDTDDAFAQGGKATSPAVTGICMNTVKIRNMDFHRTERFTMEIYQENMRFPLESGRIVDISVSVNEKDTLTQEDVLALTKANRLEAVTDETGIMTEAWVTWDRVDDFMDSAPDSRHYAVNRNEGYIVFGNGRNGRIPSASRTENIRVTYACGGGEKTNLPEGSVTKLDRAVGFVSGVDNPVPLLGGCDQETLQEAIRRSAVLTRTQNKPVTARDYEELVRYASRKIRYVRCFAGLDAEGRQERGAITLVVLQKDYKNRSVFHAIRDEIREYLAKRAAGGLIALDKIYITEPKLVEMKITAELTVGNMNRIFHVKKEIQIRLAAFLDALSGNFDGSGWKIGTLPNEIQIRNAISGIADIDCIRNIFITYYLDDAEGRREVDVAKLDTKGYLLPESGAHEVLITAI